MKEDFHSLRKQREAERAARYSESNEEAKNVSGQSQEQIEGSNVGENKQELNQEQ